jgi:outer membrane beta-barrel protein
MTFLVAVPMDIVLGANIQGPRRSALEKLENGDAVRNRLLLRSGRFEMVPGIGFTLNDAFRRNVLFGLDLDYNMSDTLAVGAAFQYGLSFDSALKERLQAERPERVATSGFKDVQLTAAAELTYTPIFGKLAFMGRKVLDYDAHFIVGLGIVSLAGNTDVEGVAPMAVLGAGLRLFVSPSMALSFQVKDQLYSSSLNSVAGAGTETAGAKSSSESRVRSSLAVSIGYSFFFPAEPKVSD